MNEIVYNNYDLVAFEQNGEVVVAVTFYRIIREVFFKMCEDMKVC